MNASQIKISDTRFPALTRAVLGTVDRESLVDVCNHGADSGFPGFTYYKDTEAFFAKHKADILSMAQAMAEDIGEDMLTMIGGFACLKSEGLTPTQIGGAIFGSTDDNTGGWGTVRNAMAWFALEEVARELNPDL